MILAAGLFELGDLAGPLGSGIRGQVVVGALLSGILHTFRYVSTGYLADRSLRPFGGLLHRRRNCIPGAVRDSMT